MKNKKDLILPIYLIINVLYLLVASFLWCHNKMYFQTYSYGFIGLLIINVILIIMLFIKKTYKKNIIDIFLILCLIFGIISTIFAYNSHDALFGFNNRYEGLLQICYYLSILFLSSHVDSKYKKYIIYAVLFTGVIEFFYGFLQVTDYFEFIKVKGRGVNMARGMITNANFYGTYMLICLGYALGLFLDKKNNIFCFSLFILFLFGLLISNALSSIVGFICILIYLFIYMFFSKNYVKFIIVIFSSVLLTIGLTKLDLTFAITDLIRTKDEIVEIGKGNFDDSFGTDRMYVWKKTLEIVPENIITGVGVDNYYYAFDGKPLYLYNGLFVYDKAHNEYLQTLITQGIFALISYLCLFGTITIKGIKNSFKNKELYLILPIGGYLIQAFFNISVIEVAPLFYIGLGLLVNRDKYSIEQKM